MSARRLRRPVSASVRRVGVRAAQQAGVLGEREREPDDRERDRGERQPVGELVRPGQLVGDEHGERQGGEHRGRDEPAGAARRRARLPPQRPPRRIGEEQVDDGPQGRDQLARLVGAERDLAGIHRVGDGLQAERERHRRPRRARPPAGERERGDHEREQGEVGQRIGEVGGERRGVPARPLHHGREQQGRDHRADRGRADGGVHPQARPERRPQPGVHERDRPDARRRVGGQPQRVGRRRVRRHRARLVDVLPHDLAGRPQRRARRRTRATAGARRRPRSRAPRTAPRRRAGARRTSTSRRAGWRRPATTCSPARRRPSRARVRPTPRARSARRAAWVRRAAGRRRWTADGDAKGL